MKTEIPVVLAVDDEEINLHILGKLMEEAGLKYLSAKNGADARRILPEERPDLLLLDIMMPGEDGFQVLDSLRREPAGSDLPVIFLSVLDDVESKIKAFDLGAVDYVTKPFERREVLARVRTHLKLAASYKAVIRDQAEKLLQVGQAQRDILVHPSELPEAGFAVRFETVLEAGGDFYDVFPVGAGTGYFVADVSGHDLQASFATSSLKALVRQNAGPLYSPLDTMRNINAVLRTFLKCGRHLTAQYLLLNRWRTEATLLSAGHPGPVYVPVRGEPRIIEGRGDILGAFEKVVLDPLRMKVEEGDRFYMYTDGLVESGGPGRRKQGQQALLASCEARREQPPEETLDGIMSDLAVGAESASDDVVVLVLEV